MTVQSFFTAYKRMSTLLALLFVFGSCRTDFFTQPLPIDAPDLIDVPVRLRGTFRFIDSSDTMQVQLLKRSIIITQSSRSSFFVKGYWADRVNAQELPVLPMGYIPEYEIRLDSLLYPADTIHHFIEHNNRIYPVKQSDFGLKAGQPFYRSLDTLIAQNAEISVVDLGKNAFFRQVNKDCYVLNLLSTQWSEEPGWWFLYMISVEGDGLELREILPDNSDSLKLHFYQDDNDKSYLYYYDLSWTRAQMREKFRNGAFSKAGRFVKIE